jgi:hypothetical protein
MKDTLYSWKIHSYRMKNRIIRHKSGAYCRPMQDNSKGIVEKAENDTMWILCMQKKTIKIKKNWSSWWLCQIYSGRLGHARTLIYHCGFLFWNRPNGSLISKPASSGETHTRLSWMYPFYSVEFLKNYKTQNNWRFFRPYRTSNYHSKIPALSPTY